MNAFCGEILGTALLVLLGEGAVANVILARSKGQNAGWIVVVTGWAMGVFVGAFTVANSSGAHLNPAVSLGLAFVGKFSWSQVPVYIAGQLLGAMVGALFVWLAYLPHWKQTIDPDAKRSIFCTAPAIRQPIANLMCEVIGTLVLILGIFGIKGAVMQSNTGAAVPLDMGALGVIPVAFLVWGICLALGGPTGYAINPARDLGPRIVHALLPISGKAGSDWGYAWVPVLGPMIGAGLAAGIYGAVGGF
jgi:glycerol uptake facilitator protein